MSMNWDQYFMSMAFFVAMKSKDPNTQVGAVIVGPDHEIVSTGYNGLPRGAKDSDARASDKNLKYMENEHAERNALFNNCRGGGPSTVGCVMYTLELPCTDCARAIIQSGIKKIVIYRWWKKHGITDKWKESFEVSERLLRECGVEVADYDGPLITQLTNRYQGKTLTLELPETSG